MYKFIKVLNDLKGTFDIIIDINVSEINTENDLVKNGEFVRTIQLNDLNNENKVIMSFTKSKDKYTSINVVKEKSDDVLDVRISDDEINEKYPLTYNKIVAKLKERYKNFNQHTFNKINKEVREKNTNAYCKYLDSISKKGGSKWFYNANIIPEYDRCFELK